MSPSAKPKGDSSMTRRRSFDLENHSHGGAPIPAATVIDRLVVSGGISGLDPATGKLPESLEEQCRFMFANVRRVMEKAGGSPNDIIKMTVWMKDRAGRAAVNKEWLEIFPDEHSRPARHTLAYEGLAPGVHVQCDLMALLPERA
jgi:enamine deaminase RidA (YjgF/YER057c/UK114 family)